MRPRLLPAADRQQRRVKPVVVMAIAGWAGCAGPSGRADVARPEDLTAAISSALDSVWVVAIGENHGHAEIHDLIIEVLERPEIRMKVDDIVVEFGNSLYQSVVDRFLADETVPFDSVRFAWRNTVSSPSTVWDSPVYEEFFREVQRINRESPDGRVYRVVLGDSPVDWASVASIDDLRPYFDRSAHIAGAVEREVLDRGRRALLLAGGAHLTRRDMTRPNRAGVPTAEISVVSRLDQRHPGSLFVIRSLGRGRGVDHDHLAEVPRGSLLRTRGTWFEEVAANDVSSMRNADGSPFVAYGSASLADLVDAVIYWGEATENHFLEPEPDTYLDEVYWQELNRRSLLLRGQPMDSSLRAR